MKTITHRVSGEEITIHVVERDEDLDAFVEWIKANPVLGFDTETSGGFGIYANTYKIRLAQFGSRTESYVIPVERSAKMAYFAAQALLSLSTIIIQNAMFDIQVVERHWGIKLDWKRIVDTKILAHLVDARPVRDGGPGHSLEELTAHYIDKPLAEAVKHGAKDEIAKELGCKVGEIWALVDVFHPMYNLYAGLDPILAFRVREKLKNRVPVSARGLVEYEHNLERIMAQVSAKGVLIDQKYTRRTDSKFRAAKTRSENTCKSLGLDNPNSPQQVVEAFKSFGVTEFSKAKKSGNDSANKDFLEKHMTRKDDVGKLAKAVSAAKRNGKWSTTYTQRFLATKDSENRVHPGIHTLAARTARMSITNPAAQTLPSDSSVIRNCLLADEGHVWASVDYAAQELRMAAALSHDEVMLREFQKPKDEADLHQITADAAGVDRKIGKMANFLVCYGGGWRALVEQGKVTEAVAKKTIEGFNTAYPGVDKLAKKMSAESKRNGYITTLTGRRLHTDQSRPYAAINYAIQSASRDVTGRAILALDAAGFTEYMRLPVHDEIGFSFPKAEAEEMAAEAARLMTMDIGPIKFETDVEIGEQSWGSLYKDYAEKGWHEGEEDEDE